MFGLPSKLLTRILGASFAYGITKNVLEAYEFLIHTYNDDDNVYLFGFSRGATTVRSLSGPSRSIKSLSDCWRCP